MKSMMQYLPTPGTPTVEPAATPVRYGPLTRDERALIRVVLEALDVPETSARRERVGALVGAMQHLAEHADDADLNVRARLVRLRIVLSEIGGAA